MDVKSTFQNEILREEVYVENPKGFEDPKFPNHIYRLKIVFYGLKLVPRAWYKTFTSYLLEKKFQRWGVDKTLCIHRPKDELLVAQIYIDDIVFKTTSSDLVLSFAKEMKIEFEMSMVGELTLFLGLQIRQLKMESFSHNLNILRSQLRNSIQNPPNTLEYEHYH